MSTVMYAFRASSDENLREQIGIIKSLIAPTVKYYEREGAEIQVFRTSVGIVYRVLEAGYGIKNKLWNNAEFFTQCSYDNRSDMPPEYEVNKSVAEEIDLLISQRCYSIIALVERANKA